MNSLGVEKIILCIAALFLHEINLGYGLLQFNWLIPMICYLAITNDRYAIFQFFAIGIIIDLLDSETLGFYSLYFVLLGGTISFIRLYFLNTDFLKQLAIIFLANVSFLLYLDFMNLINNTPFIAPERWLSVLITPILWLLIQLFLIPKYLNQSQNYEK